MAWAAALLLSCAIFAGGTDRFLPRLSGSAAAASPEEPGLVIDPASFINEDFTGGSVSCRAEIVDGDLVVRAGRNGDDGKVQGTPYIELPVTDTGAVAIRYSFAAIRLRNTCRTYGGVVIGRAGPGRSDAAAELRYYSTGDWQTVVADLTDAVREIGSDTDRAGTWQGSVRFYPFGRSAGKVDAGETAVIDSVAFFKTASAAAAYQGNSEGDTDMESGKWLASGFRDPGPSYRMMKLLYNFDASYKQQADKLYDVFGYGGITTNVTFNRNYLKSDKEFSLLDDAFAYCLGKGMAQLWLYDEYQWPSGSAYGMVTDGHPEFEPYGLAMIEKKGSGSSVFTLPDGYGEIKYAVVSSSGAETPVKFTARTVDVSSGGIWTLRVFATYDAWVEKDSLSQWQKGRPYVNIMNRDAIARFISLTHEAYKEKLTSSFGSVEAFFTDEPSLWTSNMTNPIHTGGKLPVYLVPWDEALPAEFEKMHGYSIFDKAASLYRGDGDEDLTVRINYYQTVGKMISENYFGQIAEWCAANGTYGSGHLLLEEKLAYHVVLYGDFLRCMNRTGYAGCDLLQVSPQKLMDTNTYVGSFVAVKMASSSARNFSKPHVLVEYNPEAIYDDNFKKDPFGTSLAGAAITRFYGADKFVMLNPQESYNSVQSRRLNEAVGRMNVLLEGAEMNSGIGVYYPIATVQGLVKADSVYEGGLSDISERYNELCAGLLKAGYDYNYVDDEAIAGGKLADGKMICGDASYSVIIVALSRAMDPAVCAKLAEFERAGGMLIWVDEIPSISSVLGKTEELKAAVAPYAGKEIRVFSEGGSFDELKNVLDRAVVNNYALSFTDGVLVSPYKRDGKQLICAVNSTPTAKLVNISFGDGEKFDVYDICSGTITSCEGAQKIALNGYESVVIVYEKAVEPQINPAVTGEPSQISGGGFPVVPVAAGISTAAVAAGAVIAAVLIRKRRKRK